ncbi:MAG: phosphatidylserine decarboxylase [Bacteroidia bacterium]
MVKFHRAGRREILGYWVIALGVGLGVYFLPWAWVKGIVWGLLLVGGLFVMYFFRLPMRCTPNQKAIWAPCDGKVVAIVESFEPYFFEKPVRQISIFMSPLNVHVNWAPVSGVIRLVKYFPGAFRVAWHPKASLANEQTLWIFESPWGFVGMRQIAGALARRILTFRAEGEQVSAGKEIGFIKFGSRVDVLLPLEWEITVRVGQKVRGCETPLAQCND